MNITIFTVLIFLYLCFFSATAQESLLVKVKGGIYTMGCTIDCDNEPRERLYRDLPAHKVKVNDFYISKFEVTQQEFELVMGYNPSEFKGENRSVENVTWFQAVEYCNLLSVKREYDPCYEIKGSKVSCDFKKNGYRLLTEAEWEYAAKEGCETDYTLKYSGSNNIDEVAWISVNSNGETHNVGKKKANKLGIYDMSGNVTEWCWDWFAPYQSIADDNPTGPVDGTHKVERGGSWKYPDKASIVSRRHFVLPNEKYSRLGFRIGKSCI